MQITFVHLHEHVSKKSTIPRRFSLIVESWDTIKLAWAGLHILTPDIFVDTTGCAFTFLVGRLLANCKIAAYVHYPTISTDMLSLVWDRRPTYNNNAAIAKNSAITYAKLIYYTMFAICYGFVGSLSSLTMVNSSWTMGHIRSLWRYSTTIRVIFPPCDTTSLEDLQLASREQIILSIGQFRPEKDHQLQIRSFALLVEKMRENKQQPNVQLVLIGSCRGDADEARVRELRLLSDKLRISGMVQFVINQPYPVLKSWLGRSSIGVHTMWNEHFGIGVVEMMAAGLITIAHNSGGPKEDIVVPLKGNRTGYLASSTEEYTDAMYDILFINSTEENLGIRERARESSKSFSDDVFDRTFKEALLSSKFIV